MISGDAPGGHHLQMQLVPPVGGVLLDVVRCGPARATKTVANMARQMLPGVTRRVQQQHADQPEQLWEIPAGDERFILDWCC